MDGKGEIGLAEEERQLLTALLYQHMEGGTPADRLAPLVDRLGGLTDGLIRAERAMPGRHASRIAEQMAMTVCAATVTGFKDRGARVPDAVKRIASASGIGKRALSSWRDNINRAVKSDFVLGVYNEYLAELQAMSDEHFEAEALVRVQGLGRFVRNPV